MKQTTVCTLLAALAMTTGAIAADKPSILNETPAQKEARLAWWRNDRFGMFIHFGLYAMPARHEWVKCYERISDASYDSKYLPRFNPDLFDARDWARRAKAAGMKYVVLTTKHHEGFCMWDTATTDYKITKTPFGRDLVKEYVEALRAEGLKVGFYFSIMDWHHPDYMVDGPHPEFGRIKDRHLPDAEMEAEVAKLNKGRDMNRYREYMFAQVRELLTNYGKIDIIWYDYTPSPDEKGRYGKTWKDWNAIELLKLTHELQPGILVDNRLGLFEFEDGGDFVTPEQFKVSSAPMKDGKYVPWETCQTFSGSWGYYRDEATWKSPAQLIELLIHTVSFGGNLIMNVGPTARGEFDERACERLDAFGKWMHANSRAIYGCTMAPEGFKAPDHTLLTYNPKTNCLYIHLLAYPMGNLNIDFADKIAYAQFLHDGSELQIAQARVGHAQDGASRPGGIRLPMLKPNVTIPVIELYLK